MFLRSFLLFLHRIPGFHTRGICAVECVTAHLLRFDEDYRSDVVFCFDERSIVYGHRLFDDLSVPLRRSWIRPWACVLRQFPPVCLSGRSSLVFTASLVSAYFSGAPVVQGGFGVLLPPLLSCEYCFQLSHSSSESAETAGCW